MSLVLIVEDIACLNIHESLQDFRLSMIRLGSLLPVVVLNLPVVISSLSGMVLSSNWPVAWEFG